MQQMMRQKFLENKSFILARISLFTVNMQICILIDAAKKFEATKKIFFCPNTYIETFRKHVSRNSLYMAIEINRLSLNSDGALRTIIQRRTPQARNNTSTRERESEIERDFQI